MPNATAYSCRLLGPYRSWAELQSEKCIKLDGLPALLVQRGRCQTKNELGQHGQSWRGLSGAAGRRKADVLIIKTNGKALSMSGFKEPGFADRQKAAQEARKNILDKFRSQPGPDDPAVKARQAEREAIASARAKVSSAREAAKAEQKRLAEEAASAAAAQRLREKEEVVARQAALEAEQKAARDARYAARKKKKK